MIGYDSNFLSEYIKKIGKLVLGNIDDKNKKDVEETLKKSLINGKTFYENAPEYIRKEMEGYKEIVNGYKNKKDNRKYRKRFR